MNKIQLAALAAITGGLSLGLADEEDQIISKLPLAGATAARILGDIPDGTPPPPEPPKPKFIVPAKDVRESKSIQQGGRTITLREINPIALPPPPPPIEPLSPEAEAAFREKVAAYRTSHPQPKDITPNYWRIDPKPTATTKEGAR